MPDVCASRPWFVVPTTQTAPWQVVAAARYASEQQADAVEVRLDYLRGGNGAITATMEGVADAITLPVIWTYRTVNQGGHGCDSQYVDHMKRIAQWCHEHPPVHHPSVTQQHEQSDGANAAASRWLIDCQWPYIAQMHDYAPSLALVASHHDWDGMWEPARVVSLMRDMEEAGASVAKLALMAQGPADLRAFYHIGAELEHVMTIPYTLIAMGHAGVLSRVFPEMTGSCLSFVTADSASSASAPGQLSRDEVMRLREYFLANCPC